MDYIIELKDIVKKFDNKCIINHLNLKIKKGEIFGFLGPNGAGKTTTINMIVGILKPTSGEILIDNADNSRLGVCMQDIILWDSLTCYENLFYMGKLHDMDKNKLKADIDNILDKLSLKDKKNTRIDKLSGGMKRRMNIAMATIHNPDILILDEPSEGLDPQSRRVLWDYIVHQKELGKTVILTTHLMDEADILSDRVAIIDRGELLSLDTPYNLKSSIGEGDVVELTVKNHVNEIMDDLNQIDSVKNVLKINGKISLTVLNAVGKLPQIIHIVEDNNSELIDISIRQNTLEDVFIELTGKQLRE